MALTRSTSLSPSDIANRKLPDLPAEPYSSRLSRIWNSFKDKLTLRSGSNRRLRRSQSHHGGSTGDGSCYKTPLPYSIYYHLIDNHQTMVLPGLRQYPPPIEDDTHPIPNRMSLPPLPTNRNQDYADIEIYEGAANTLGAACSDSLEEANGMAINEYQDICEISSRSKKECNSAVGPRIAALGASINTLHHQGWYWGPLNREDTERRLRAHPTGAFLVRDSKDEHHLYTLSFKQGELVLHTRIEFVNGLFTFFLSDTKAKETGKPSVEELITTSMENGVKGEFGDSRRIRGRPLQAPIHIQLLHPVSRFSEVRSLQFLCKFVLRANMNRDDVTKLPLPVHVKKWVHEKQYF